VNNVWHTDSMINRYTRFPVFPLGTENDAVQARFYTVQSGDSLGAISITFFGSSEYYDVIFQANKGLLSSPDRIRVGQRLVIPQLDA
jgi:nucleoid-associated protein YgaU